MTLLQSLKAALKQHPELAQALTDPNYGKGFTEAPSSASSPLSKDRKGVVDVVKSTSKPRRGASTPTGSELAEGAQQ